MLFVLHDSPFLIRRKSVQSLFKNRIRSGLFTEALIQKTLSCHASALCGEDCFEGIKQLAHSLACSVEPVLNHFAFVIFR